MKNHGFHGLARIDGERAEVDRVMTVRLMAAFHPDDTTWVQLVSLSLIRVHP